jgi:hypothetical protein
MKFLETFIRCALQFFTLRLVRNLCLFLAIALGSVVLASGQASGQGKPSLRDELLFLASFDGTVAADVAVGDGQLFTAESMKSIAAAKPGLHDPAVELAIGKGLVGDALEFKSKKRKLIFYKASQNIAYDSQSSSGCISFWLQLDPATDLEPGFCDPIQITDSRYNDAAIWVDFTKENPRDFRLGVIGDLVAWNPENASPDNNPEFEKRLIPVKQPDFARGKWSHVLINFEGLNSDDSTTELFFDGKSKGKLDVKDPFTWEVEKAHILLGLSYVGLMDELAIFKRPLSSEEVKQVFDRKDGLKKLLGVNAENDDRAKVDESKKDESDVDVQDLVRKATSQIVQIQEEDGAWPYEGVYRVRRKIPVGYRVGGTSIVCSSLLYCESRPETTEAIGRGVEVILKNLEHELMKPDTTDTYDVRVWGHIYTLDLFCRIKLAGNLEDLCLKTDPWIPKLVEYLKAEQIADGGWNYAGQKRHASFVTAPAVQALLLARQLGHKVPDAVFYEAREVLKKSRTQEGAFQYSGTVGRRQSSLPGSIARSAICETTMMLLGEGNTENLRSAIDAFHLHWDELEKRRKKTGTHKPPYNIAPYYFYYGHRYVAQAIQFLPAAERTAERERFKAVLLRTKDEDNTWNDRVFDRSKAYGTAMSVLALLGDVPVPKAVLKSD